MSNKLLMKPGGAYSDPVRAYGGYRASAQGGSYDTLVVDMDQLYNQFSYGEPTPLAIHNLMRFMIAGGNPQYLFLIGKGLDAWWNYHRTPASFTTNRDLVPTPGMPGSDMFYTAGMDGVPGVPAVATGRITANTPAQVAGYLDKVVEMESLPFDQLWRKDILHLSGGIDPGEPELFKSYVQDFEAIAVDYYLGGKVASISKRTTNPVELINISDQVNSGVSLITFFGHSSSSTIDFDIGYASDPVMGYANKGRYPMFLINGCQAGAFFSNSTVFGEDWIRTPDKGAVGFIAHASFGLINTLKLYSDLFYEVAFADQTFINKGVGDVQKEVARRYLDFAGNSVISESQVQQMVLLGDPSISIFGAMQPDYEVNDSHLYLTSFDGGPINALADSFALNIVVRNFGKAGKDTLSIRITRTLNDNSTITYDSLFAPVLYSDTLTFVVRKGHENGFGNNSFTVKLDADEYIDELNEDNNTAALGLFIPLNSTHHLFPHDFAIVNEQSIDLSYQSTNQLAGERTFLVEVDTVNTFDSPYSTTFQRTANVYDKLPFALLAHDSLTYYWRTRLADPLPGESEEWSSSSFTYIDQSPEGWGQLHFQQYLKNGSEGIVVDADTRRLSFKSSVTPVKIVNFGKDHPAVNTDVNILIDGVEYNLTTQGFICRSNTMNFIAFDRRSTVPYVGLAFKWFNRAGRECGRAPWVINSFTPSQMVTGLGDDLVQYVDNVITGDSVVMFSIDNAAFTTWPAAAKTKLGELGVSVAQIDALVDGEPVVIFGRKGSPAGSAKIYRTAGSPAGQQQLTTEGTITGRYLSGEMTTPIIGPAASWSQLAYRTSEVEAQDLVNVSVTGVELDGNETVLIDNASAMTDLSQVDAATYPYIKLTYTAEDDINLTPAQLDHWLVLYESMAEGLLLYIGSPAPVTVVEGVTFQSRYAFVNISDKTFSDSLTVRAEVFNKERLQLSQQYFKIYPPAPGDTTLFVTNINTLGRSGANDLDVFVNPKLIPELYYDNNVVELRDYLQVAPDIYKPVVEVRFDGRIITDGDYVSPNPGIEIKLWDENQYLRKIDTVGVNIYLQYPCDTEDCTYERIALSRADVSWQPATTTSDFRIMFAPTGLDVGTYRLRVEAQDASGNAGDPYLISFQVTNENSIDLLAPYPNPFDESVVFRFVVTGSEKVGLFDLQIVDLGGREIYAIQLSDFPVGTSEVIWDGVDNTGRRLPPRSLCVPREIAGGQ
ncbi:MAG: hypothetical protein HC859_12895 [Bacteroidia bacterium]|nr:hypothetical protein [Bacteroidia bacterium]